METRILYGMEIEKSAEDWAVYDAEIALTPQQEVAQEKTWAEMSLEEVMFAIRLIRNRLLEESDSLERTSNVLIYRRALRKFPETITEKPVSLESVQFPEVIND